MKLSYFTCKISRKETFFKDNKRIKCLYLPATSSLTPEIVDSPVFCKVWLSLVLPFICYPLRKTGEARVPSQKSSVYLLYFICSCSSCYYYSFKSLYSDQWLYIEHFQKFRTGVFQCLEAREIEQCVPCKWSTVFNPCHQIWSLEAC